jgi:hypothetical protein
MHLPALLGHQCDDIDLQLVLQASVAQRYSAMNNSIVLLGKHRCIKGVTNP